MVAKEDLSTLNWDNFRFMVFDVPNHKGTYAERYHHLGNTAFLFYPSSLTEFF